MIWPKYLNFLLSTFASKLLLTPACSKTHEFVLFAVHDTRNRPLKLKHFAFERSMEATNSPIFSEIC